jgi:hypothetical protein
MLSSPPQRPRLSSYGKRHHSPGVQRSGAVIKPAMACGGLRLARTPCAATRPFVWAGDTPVAHEPPVRRGALFHFSHEPMRKHQSGLTILMTELDFVRAPGSYTDLHGRNDMHAAQTQDIQLAAALAASRGHPFPLPRVATNNRL